MRKRIIPAILGSGLLSGIIWWISGGNTPQPVPIPDPSPNPIVIDSIAQLLTIHNNNRNQRNIAPLALNDKLTTAAQKHAQWMSDNRTLSHTGAHRSTFADRISAEGYSFSTGGENIANGYDDADAVMAGWMNSSGHRANILNPDYHEVGLGVSNNYWCTVFASPLNLKQSLESPYSHLRPLWIKHIDNVIDNIVANKRPKTIVLGENGQGKIRSFVNREPSRMTEFLEMRPDSLNYSEKIKSLKEIGASTAAIDAETLEFNLLMIERLQQKGFTFKVIGVTSSKTAKSPWLKAELETLERLGVKWEIITESQVEEVMKLPSWR